MSLPVLNRSLSVRWRPGCPGRRRSTRSALVDRPAGRFVPFALADEAVLAGALLGAGLAASLTVLILAVPGIRRADRQGVLDRRRRSELWSLPNAVERRLAVPLLGAGDGAHSGA
ncbi:hypothetical protein [Streptomyces sp. NBC_00207]|uniref:hypothetical protein n=1 Tax=Streptomyces sp. NBC_00207 TaxID=2903635 RepID=UPI003247292A